MKDYRFVIAVKEPAGYPKLNGFIEEHADRTVFFDTADKIEQNDVIIGDSADVLRGGAIRIGFLPEGKTDLELFAEATHVTCSEEVLCQFLRQLL